MAQRNHGLHPVREDLQKKKRVARPKLCLRVEEQWHSKGLLSSATVLRLSSRGRGVAFFRVATQCHSAVLAHELQAVVQGVVGHRREPPGPEVVPQRPGPHPGLA